MLVCGFLTLAGVTVFADDNKDDKAALKGTWAQTGGQVKIEFIDKDVMKIFPHGDSESAVIVCSYTIAKGAVVKAKVTALEGKAKEKLEQIVPVGLEFNFKWLVKDTTAAVEDVKGDKIPDALKSHMEGKYDEK